MHTHLWIYKKYILSSSNRSSLSVTAKMFRGRFGFLVTGKALQNLRNPITQLANLPRDHHENESILFSDSVIIEIDIALSFMSLYVGYYGNLLSTVVVLSIDHHWVITWRFMLVYFYSSFSSLASLRTKGQAPTREDLCVEQKMCGHNW